VDGLRAGFHRRWSRSQSRNQKRRVLRSSENQTDEAGGRTPIPLMSRSLMLQSKLDCRSRKQKWKNMPITVFDFGPCDKLVLPLLLPIPTI